jgi:hypothetical protein
MLLPGSSPLPVVGLALLVGGGFGDPAARFSRCSASMFTISASEGPGFEPRR